MRLNLKIEVEKCEKGVVRSGWGREKLEREAPCKRGVGWVGVKVTGWKKLGNLEMKRGE
jgi:hypothetical protein